MTFDRRAFLAAGTAATAALAAPVVWGASSGRPKVVVIGGGPGGATVARYLSKDSDGGIDVTVIEPSQIYHTCFFSNLYLGGFRTGDSLAQSYTNLKDAYGIKFIHDRAVGIDRSLRTVTVSNGESFSYDRLVLSPGVDFIEGAVPGWEMEQRDRMPHAYKQSASQIEVLREQVFEMPAGGVFAMVAPPDPYKCPPGPYERVSMVARVLKHTNPTAKIIIADPKSGFSKEALFREAWAKHYDGMIEWVGQDAGGGNVSVDANAMSVTIDGETIGVDVCNVIPAQKAGQICDLAGVNQGNWAPIVPTTMQSTVDENIHILGDAANQGDMPKSAFSANSQAKAAAMAIRAALTGSRAFPPRYSNTCWSLLFDNDGVKVSASYKAGETQIEIVDGFLSATDEDAELRKQTYLESLDWYESFVKDVFG